MDGLSMKQPRGSILGYPVEVVAAVILGTMGYSSYLALPLLLGVLAETRHLTAVPLGWIASAEMAGLLIGSVGVSRLITMFSARQLATVGIAVTVAANLGTAVVATATGIAVARWCVGLGGGICYSIAMARLAAEGDATRNFSLLTVLTVVQTSILLVLIPLLAGGGLLPVVAMLAFSVAMVAFLLPFLRATALSEAATQVVVGTGALSTGRICLVAAVIFGFVIGSGWAFIERIGTLSGMGVTQIGTVLNVANFAGVATCWLAARLAGYGRPRLLVGVALVAAAAAMASWPVGADTIVSYTLRCLIVFQALTFVQIYLLAIFARTDPTGSQAALASAAMGVGLAIGPAATAIVADTHGFRAAFMVDGALLIGLLAILWFAYGRLGRIGPA